jgi:HSP20 family molecular chaperone IbpA
MAIRRGFGIEEFERSFDEFFNEMLIDRWNCGRPAKLEGARLIDTPESYEIRLAAAGVEPGTIDLEISGQRLRVRMPAKLGGTFERAVSFSEPIDGERASAKWSDGTLTIILPKRKGRRIALKES